VSTSVATSEAMYAPDLSSGLAEYAEAGRTRRSYFSPLSFRQASRDGADTALRANGRSPTLTSSLPFSAQQQLRNVSTASNQGARTEMNRALLLDIHELPINDYSSKDSREQPLEKY
jgi:hypothetical protein